MKKCVQNPVKKDIFDYNLVTKKSKDLLNIFTAIEQF